MPLNPSFFNSSSIQPITHLEVNGNDFISASGQRIVICGCDMFLAFRQFLDGGATALQPFISESQSIGFNCWRIFMMGSSKQNGVLQLDPAEPGYYNSVRPFVELLNQNGVIPLATIYVDNQDIKAPIEHWSQMAALLRGSQTLLSGGNQFSKNGFDPYQLTDPGMIWSRGSDIEDTKLPPNGATASELHSTRVSWDRSLMDAAASPINMRESGSTMVWMTEGIPFDQDSDPFIAWQLGRIYATCWSLAIMHNRQSQRGLLMTGRIKECAAAWTDGMKL